jgi:hypothetical protein
MSKLNALVKMLLFSLITVTSFSQNKISKEVDPYSLIINILNYSNTSYFTGTSKTGYVYGDSYFDFSKMSRQFPNVIVTYTALSRSSREGGVLRNFRFLNSGNFNTKVLLADWQNFDKNTGSGTFELSLLDEKNPNKIYIGIRGSSWSYYFNLELSPTQFQEIINLLTVSGMPRNLVKEREAALAGEKLKKEEEERNKRKQLEIDKKNAFTYDSLRQVEKRIKDSLLIIKNKINDSIIKFTHDSLIKVLNVGVIFQDGIIINFINPNEVAILSLEEKFFEYGNLKQLINSNPDYYNSWQVPTIVDLVYIKSVLKKNKLFNDNFNLNMLPKKPREYPSYIYWHTSGFKQFKSILLPLDFGFDYVFKYQDPNSFEARLRMIKRVRF